VTLPPKVGPDRILGFGDHQGEEQGQDEKLNELTKFKTGQRDRGTSAIFDEEDNRYRMWIALTRGIMYTESNDGITWDSLSAITLTGGVVESKGPIAPRVIKVDNRYHMWYIETQSIPVNYLKYAQSSNGKDWTRIDGRILGPEETGYSNGLTGAAVTVRFEDNMFNMWGSVTTEASASGGGTRHSDLFHSVSDDGIRTVPKKLAKQSFQTYVPQTYALLGNTWPGAGSIIGFGTKQRK